MGKELLGANPLTSSSRHRQRKGLQRLQDHLQKSAIGKFSSVPTKTIAIGNAGLACGLSFEDVYGVLANFDVSADFPHEDDHKRGHVIHLVPDKPFTVVEFCCENFAKFSVNMLTGFIFRLENGTSLPWYPSFVSRYPSTTNNTMQAVPVLPPDLILLLDFLSEPEEKCWTKFIDDVLMDVQETLKIQSSKPASVVLKNRTTFHFGYQFRYGTNDVDHQNPVEPIPLICSDILQRLLETGYLSVIPDQLTINMYDPGQGIPSHVDTHSVFEDNICSISLGSPVVMHFVSATSELPVVLPPRSAMILRGESRYAWKHGISPRTTDSLPERELSWRRSRRISFTFRKIRNRPCECSFTEYCDSQSGRATSCEKKKLSADVDTSGPMVEEKFVHEVYENIAPHFSETRHKAWPKIASFVSALLPGSVLIDVGCGNGKYLGTSGGTLIQIGCDRSSNLIGICRQRGLEVLVADILSLPYRNNCCDAILCIAVIHHMSSEERRVQALNEIVRVLSVEGLALVYVWAMEQKRDQKNSTYLKSEKALSGNSSTATFDHGDTACSLPVHVNRTEFQSPDVLVPWHLKSKQEAKESDKVFHRYYHVFREGELRQCCNRVSGVEVIEEYYDEGNWCVVLRKSRS